MATEPSLARLPQPPYTAVIFTSRRTPGDHGYAVMAARMDDLVAQQPGYLMHESARSDADGAIGITVSYWSDEAAAQAWKAVQEHLVAQRLGRSAWYSDYTVRVCTVHRAYGSVAGAEPVDQGHDRR